MKGTLAVFIQRSLAAMILISILAAPALTQTTSNQPAVLTNPLVNRAIHSDVSRPLRDMATEASQPIGFHEAPPVLYPHLKAMKEAAARGDQAKDSALQLVPGPAIAANIGLNLLGLGIGFPNYYVPDAPTDVNLAVGDTQVVQWLNVSYAVFDKATGAILQGPVTGNALWSGFGGACEANNSGDPVVQWDKIAHRWVMAQNVFASPYTTCIAVSTTPDATGTYYRFAFPQTGFPDYPKWGLWSDAYYQSQNIFLSGNFWGLNVCAYQRTKLLAGDSSALQICFQTGATDDSLLPADIDSATNLPPSGEPEIFLGSINGGTPGLYQYLFHVDFNTPGNSTFTGTGMTKPVSGVASYSMACGGFGACITQPNGGELLDAVADRLMYRLAYRNFSDHQTLLATHAVTAGNSTGERWYELRAAENSTTFSVYQQGTYAPDSNYRWMGSIAMDSAQDIALGYSVSGSNLYPTIAYTGRVPTDALGTMESEGIIFSGTGSQIATSNRWGDYTALAIDASDDCTFWYTNQYYTATTSFGWSTRLASFKFPNCAGAGPDFSISALPTSLTVVQGNQGSTTVSTTVKGGFSNDIALSASGLPSGTSVSFSTNPIAAPGSGSSAMTIAVGAAVTPGTYTITVDGNGGGVDHTTAVTLIVTTPPTFTIAASPTSLSVAQGGKGTSTITTAVSGGFNNAVSLSATGLPSGATAAFSTNPIAAPGSGKSTLTITVGAGTAAGTYPVTITGTGGGVNQSTTVTLTVTSAPTFTLAASPASLVLLQGTKGTSTITSTISGGFNSAVSLSTSGAPGGTSLSISPNKFSAPGSGTATLTVSVGSSTAPGTYTITVTGSGGGLKQTATLTLTVVAPFSVSASPASVSVVRGKQVTSTITTAINGGFNGAIALSISGLPGGVTASFNPATIAAPGNGSSVLTITTKSNAGTGTKNLTITGTSGSVKQTTTLSLTITAQ